MSERDAAGETEMDQLMRTIPPMDVTMAVALLREAGDLPRRGPRWRLHPLGRRYRPRLQLWDARPNQAVGGVRGRGLQGSRIPRRGGNVQRRDMARHHETPHTDRLVLLPRPQGPRRPLPECQSRWSCLPASERSTSLARGFSYPVHLKSTFAASTDRTGRRPSVSAMRRTSSITSRLSGWLGPGVSGGSSRSVSRAGPLCFKSSGSMAGQSRMAKSPWRVWAGAGRMATATRGATCPGKTYTPWSCGRRDGKRCYMRSSLRPVGGTCTGPTPSGRRGVSSCSQRSADGGASTLRRCANPAADPRRAARRGTSGRRQRWGG